MNNKYSNKKKTNQNKVVLGKVILLLLLLTALAAAILFLVKREERDSEIPAPTQLGTEPTQIAAAPIPEETVKIESVEEMRIDLGNGLEIMDIGSYTGMYMEDGSDEIVSGVLMMVVTNNSDQSLQYAEISLTAGDEIAAFSLSTLPAGESVVVLEQKRMSYDRDIAYTSAEAQNVAWFNAPLSLREDRLEIQSLNGALNITNISDEDITGDIVIYYKNSSSDMLYGGITYRVRITGGLAAGEITQIMSDHYSADGSTIMFVTCG